MLCTVYLLGFWSGPGDSCRLCNPIEFPLEFSGTWLMRGSLWCHRPRYMLMWLASLTSLSELSYMLFSFCLSRSVSFYTTFDSKNSSKPLSPLLCLFFLSCAFHFWHRLFSLSTLTFNVTHTTEVFSSESVSLSIYISVFLCLWISFFWCHSLWSRITHRTLFPQRKKTK